AATRCWTYHPPTTATSPTATTTTATTTTARRRSTSPQANWVHMQDYIPFVRARATQAQALETAIGAISAEVRAQQAAGAFRGPGPIFVGIGASLAAACAPTWTLRGRGIHAWRLGAGDHPLPFPATPHPVVGVSQSGRSAETLAVLDSVARDL